MSESKPLQGGSLFVLLLAILLVPFFIFSTSNPQVSVNRCPKPYNLYP